jgi:hypothetical protein
MKLVLDDDGHPVTKKTENGQVLPVYEYEDGTQKEFNAGATLDGLNKKIGALTEEKDRHFQAKEKFEEQLKTFEGIDVKKAKEAVRIVKNLEDQKLIDEKGVEAVKAEVRKDMKALSEERETALKKAHENDLKEWGGKFEKQEKLIRNLVVGNLFANDDHFAGETPRTIYPPGDAHKIFGHHVDVKIEDGQVGVTMRGNDGKTIISKVEHGEPADFHEGISLILDKHPRKDSIMRAGRASGPGSSGNIDNKDKKLDDMAPVEKIARGLQKFKQTGTANS